MQPAKRWWGAASQIDGNQVSGWQDSNLRPPGSKPGALTKLRYTLLFLLRVGAGSSNRNSGRQVSGRNRSSDGGGVPRGCL